MSWFRRHWKVIAGVACGAGTAVLAVTPAAALAPVAGALCATFFGAEAYTVGHSAGKAAVRRDVADLVGHTGPIFDVLNRDKGQ